ncbi:putative ribonuclease H-like domain-containing protein [Tanacetum coccineum]|uniref:Ribonuclease H-like domain-containing protein n=1 Tax=Tanacetum coccineum TaxID=301880 RepID=A0ABQ5F2A7_9ASTR
MQRLSHQTRFVPTTVLTRTSRIPVNTASHNFNSQAVSTSAARKVNVVRPIVNENRPRNNFYKSHSPIRRTFNRTRAPRTNFSNHKVNTTRYMTGNKAYLAEYQDYNGGPVAFRGKGPNWLFDLDYLTDSMNYQPVRSENQANKTAGPKEANHSAGTQNSIDARNSEMEVEPAQDYFVLPIWSSYTSTVKSSETKNEANDVAEALRKEFAQDTEDLLLQAGAARATSTNTVNTASTLVSTDSPLNAFSTGGPDLNNTDQDDSQIPTLKDIYDNPSDGIFTNASYDDEGAVADFTNLESTVNVSPIPTSRIHSIPPITQILRDPKSAVQTRSKVHKSFGAYAFEVDRLMNEVFAPEASMKPFRVILITLLLIWEDSSLSMDVNSVFLYGKIDEEVYVSQPLGFVYSKFPRKVYKVVKALYGLTHQAPRAWISNLARDPEKFDYLCEDMLPVLLIETQKSLTKDEEVADVDVHLYRSKIKVTPKTSHLNDVKRIFRYLKGKPKLGLWYPRVSSFDLEAYSDSDHAGANLDRKSTTGEYVAAANCCGQNPVFHSKTKHIEIRHHFIRDAYEKKLIQVLKIHTNDNVGDLLTKAFDVSRRPTPLTDSSSSHDTTQDSRDSLEDTNGSERTQVQSSHDSPLSGDHTSEKVEGGLNLEELFVLCTNLSNRVLALETSKDAQAAKILKLKDQIKKLKRKCKPSISHQLWMPVMILKKRLGRKESVSKHGRKNAKPQPTLDAFDDLDADGRDYIETDDVVKEGRQSNETEELNKGSGEKGGSTEELVSNVVPKTVSTARPELSTARPYVDAARQEDSAVEPKTPPTTTSIFDDEDITMAQTLIKMKKEKAKEKGVSIKDIEDSSRPARSILTLKPLPTIDPKDKGKSVLKEPEPAKKMTKSDFDAAHIARDAEIARQLQVNLQAEVERERQREEEEASKAAIAETYDEVQEGIDADALFAAKLQHEEKERSIQIEEEQNDASKKDSKEAVGVHKQKVLEEPKVEVKQDGHEESIRKRPGRRLKMKATKKHGTECIYYRIFRSDGSSRWIKTFFEMVTRFDRLDLVELYNLVMKRFETTTPEGVDLVLWGDLRTILMSMEAMMEERRIFKCWFYHHTTNGHQFTMSNRHQELASLEQTASGKDFSNPLIADSLLKTIWFLTYHASQFGRVPVSAAKQSSLRATTSTSTSRPINTATHTNRVNVLKLKTNAFHKSHSPIRRPFYKSTASNTMISNEKVNIVRVNGVNIVRQTAVSTVKGIGVTAVKASAGCVWRPKMTNFNNVSKDNSGSWVSKRGNPQQALKNQVIFDSGCSRHMTGNKDFLTDYQELDGGFVAFGGSARGGKITRKGKIRTDKLDFEDVFFVKELKFNLFSVLQMCDKKNNVLFTKTECLVLSPDFKLLNESQVLLRVPRQSPQEANGNTGLKQSVNAGQYEEKNVSTQQYIVFPLWSSISSNYKSSDENDTANDSTGESHCIKTSKQNLSGKATKASITNSFNTVSTPVNVASAPRTSNDAGKTHQSVPLVLLYDKIWTHTISPLLIKLWNAIGKKWVYRNKKDERGIVVRNKSRLVAQGYKQEEGIDYDEMEVNSAFLYLLIKIEDMLSNLQGFVIKNCPDKQTIVANSTTEAEYIAASHCCGQVLWIQNQMLDYGYNFMQTKIHFDNESVDFVLSENPVYNSKNKALETCHAFSLRLHMKEIG